MVSTWIFVCCAFKEARNFLVSSRENGEVAACLPTHGVDALVIPERMATVELHCVCRMPNISPLKRMVACKCNNDLYPKRFHYSCIDNTEDFDLKLWRCGFK